MDNEILINILQYTFVLVFYASSELACKIPILVRWLTHLKTIMLEGRVIVYQVNRWPLALRNVSQQFKIPFPK